MGFFDDVIAVVTQVVSAGINLAVDATVRISDAFAKIGYAAAELAKET